MAVGTEELLLPIRQVVKVERFPYERMTKGLVDQWGEGIPAFEEANVLRPEWQETPLREIDLSGKGYGLVFVKDESTNPTGTIKDRAAWELATLYRDFARAIYLKNRQDNRVQAEDFTIPSFSLITAGNEGLAIAERFKQHNLPPPKFILDLDTPRQIIEALKKLRASTYQVDLKSRALTTKDILALTDNKDGVDITSVQFIEPQAILYDWHVHEVFNEKPDEVYVPYGSGRLTENYLTWQGRTIRNDSTGRPDPRLRVEPVSVVSTNIFGAEPASPDSVANKLVARFKPFLLFRDQDIRGLRRFAFTGKETDIFKVDEEHLQQAHQLMTDHGIQAEPSAAAGFALYMQRWERKQIDPKKKVVVVNTGKGLYEEKPIEAVV